MDVGEKPKEREWALKALREIKPLGAEKRISEMQRKVDAGYVV